MTKFTISHHLAGKTESTIKEPLVFVVTELQREVKEKAKVMPRAKNGVFGYKKKFVSPEGVEFFNLKDAIEGTGAKMMDILDEKNGWRSEKRNN